LFKPAFSALCYTLAIVLVGLFVYRKCLPAERRDILPQRFFVYVAVVYTTAFLAPHLMIVRAALVVLPALFARSRSEAASLYLLTLPMLPPLQVNDMLGSMFLLRFSTTHFIALGLALAVMVKPGPMRPVPARFDLAFALLMLLFVVIGGRGEPFTTWLRAILDNLLNYVLPYYLLSRTLTRSEDTERALLTLGGAAFAFAGFAAFEVSRTWAVFQAMYTHLDIMLEGNNFMLKLRAGLLRPPGPFVESTSFGIFLAVGLLAAVSQRRRFKGWRWAPVIGGIGFGLVLAQARGDWIGALIGLLALYAFAGRRAAASLVAAAAGIGYVLLYLAAHSSRRIADALGMTAGTDSTAVYRQQLLSDGLNQVRASPLFGKPLSQVTASMQHLTQGEHIVDFVNSHLYVVLITGLLGFAAWLIVWAIGAASLWPLRRRRASGDPVAAQPAFVFAVLIALFVILTFTSLFERNSHWLVLMLALGGAMVAQRRPAAAAEPLIRDPSPPAAPLPSYG
jgi:O-antigen ligase